jgi:hypothetical protein
MLSGNGESVGQNVDGEIKRPDGSTFSRANTLSAASPNGIFVKRPEDGWVKVTDLGLANYKAMNTLEGRCLGYEVDVYQDGQQRDRTFLPTSCLVSKQAFQQWLSAYSASIKANDMEVASLMDYLRMAVTDTAKPSEVRSEIITYTVQPGDTLWAIAQRLYPSSDVTLVVDAMVSLNGGATILAGQQLRLP